MEGNGQMLLNKIATLTGMGVTIALCAGYVLESSALGPNDAGAHGDPGSFALMPFSLGHPIAFPGITTVRPRRPDDRDEPVAPAQPFHQTLKLGKGETLAKMLQRAGITNSDAHNAIAAFAKLFNPRRLRQGQKIKLNFYPHAPEDIEGEVTPGIFSGFKLDPNLRQQIHVRRHGWQRFTAAKIEKQLLRQPVRAEGRVESNLYVAGKKANLPADTLAKLVRAYSWDVDFQRDIRRGDTFHVMYEQFTNPEGRLVSGGNILHALLTLSGKKRAIYRFTTEDKLTNYYGPDGKSTVKALMRTPINGARLSSSFGRRHHPVLGYTKMHKGIDFAALPGTPIYAAGAGFVTYTGRNGNFGKYVRIRHNGSYNTAYAHMQKIRRGIRVGSHVDQGQVIGYVGSTGRSTGPHLHYEILHHGRQVNPLKIRMPSGRKLAGRELAQFEKHRTSIDQHFALLPTSRQLADATVMGR